MAPQKVDKLMTLKVAKLITLWRPKGGQTNNSPAERERYIYIYREIERAMQEPYLVGHHYTGSASTQELAHYPRLFLSIKLVAFQSILAAFLVSCLCAHFVGCFYECVAIAGVGVVINWLIFKGGLIRLLEVELSCRGAGNKNTMK